MGHVQDIYITCVYVPRVSRRASVCAQRVASARVRLCAACGFCPRPSVRSVWLLPAAVCVRNVSLLLASSVGLRYRNTAVTRITARTRIRSAC